MATKIQIGNRPKQSNEKSLYFGLDLPSSYHICDKSDYANLDPYVNASSYGKSDYASLDPYVNAKSDELDKKSYPQLNNNESTVHIPCINEEGGKICGNDCSKSNYTRIQLCKSCAIKRFIFTNIFGYIITKVDQTGHCIKILDKLCSDKDDIIESCTEDLKQIVPCTYLSYIRVIQGNMDKLMMGETVCSYKLKKIFVDPIKICK